MNKSNDHNVTQTDDQFDGSDGVQRDSKAPKSIGVYDRPEKTGLSKLQIIILLAFLMIMALIIYQVVF